MSEEQDLREGRLLYNGDWGVEIDARQLVLDYHIYHIYHIYHSNAIDVMDTHMYLSITNNKSKCKNDSKKETKNKCANAKHPI